MAIYCTYRAKNAALFASLSLLLAPVACGDDSEDSSSNAPANTQTTTTTPTSTTPTSTGSTTNTSTTATNTAPAVCPDGSLIVLSPTASTNISPLDDTNPDEEGVQIAVRIATNLPEGSILTLEHTTQPISIGTRIDSAEVTLENVPLSPGLNAFNAIADAPDCSVSVPFSITLEPGTSCSENSACPNGESCGPQGLCTPCASACTEDADCGPTGTCLRECSCQLPYSYILLEDRSGITTGATPGADIDSVSLIKADERELFAGRALDFQLGGAANDWDDPAQLLGPPDSDCSIANFTSLGAGWVILGFGTPEENIFIEPGDSIRVYELGPTFCPERTEWSDEPYAVSISVATDENSFVEIGTGGQGSNTISVPNVD